MTTVIAPSSTNRLIDLSPQLAGAFQAFYDAALSGGPLEAQARAAAALAAAIAFNRPEMVRSFLAAAKQAGLSNEDIGQVAGIVDALRVESHQRPAASGGTEHVHQPKASKSCC